MISTVPVMPGVSGMVAPSALIDSSSSATVTGKTKLSGWPGAVDGGRTAGAALIAELERRRRGRVGRSRLRREDERIEFAGDRRRRARQRVDAAGSAAQPRSAQRSARACEGDRQRVGRADVGVADRRTRERPDRRLRRRRLTGNRTRYSRRERRVDVGHAGRVVDGGRAAGAALIAERKRRRRGRVGRSRLRREDERVEFAGDRGRGSRQPVDPRADGRQVAEARSVSERPARAPEGDRQRVGRAGVVVAERRMRERLDRRLRRRRLAGHRPGNGRRHIADRIGTCFVDNFLDGGGGEDRVALIRAEGEAGGDEVSCPEPPAI